MHNIDTKNRGRFPQHNAKREALRHRIVSMAWWAVIVGATLTGLLFAALAEWVTR